MDKLKAKHGVAVYGSILAAFFISAGIGICAQLSIENIKQTTQAQIAAKQTEIQAAQHVIETQQKQADQMSERIDSLQKQLTDAKKHAVYLSSRGENSPLVWQTYRASWYSPSGGWDRGTITRTGTRPSDGRTIAVDPNLIPLGSTLYVKFHDGHIHKYIAEDTGGAIIGHRLDIFCSSNAECIDNGVQYVQVLVIPKR